MILEIIPNNNDEVTLHCGCIKCLKKEAIKVKKDDLDKWRRGLVIQKAFSYLTANQREIILNVICGECFEEQFPPIEEE